MNTLIERDIALDIAERSIQGVIRGDAAALRAVVHPDAINREASAEPLATRGKGPESFAATGAWLAAAYTDLAWNADRHVVDGDLVVTYGHMSGVHTGDFVVWTPDGKVDRAFAPTGRAFSVAQAHFQRIVDGMVIEHWAVRDDQGMAMQLGWIPPTPAYLFRCSQTTRRHRAEQERRT